MRTSTAGGSGRDHVAEPDGPAREDRALPPVGEFVEVCGAGLVSDPSGALYWPDHGVLAVADLHLEKGSSFARRGVLLPPYDTGDALARLRSVAARYAPRVVIALGDSFHDGGGPGRIAVADRATLLGLQRGRDWVWITGNHDPEPVPGIGGRFAAVAAIGPLLFRHAPQPDADPGEIAGHLHPVARLPVAGRAIRRRCFVTDRTRLVMPAFGAYAGGLNIRDRAFVRLFTTLDVTAYVLGEARLHAFAAARCVAD